MTNQQPADDRPEPRVTREPGSRGTVRRVLGLLRPERGKLWAVAVLCVLSVGSFIAGPAVLGIATNILFDGVVSKLVPTGVSRAQSIALLRARGQGSLADIFSAMHVQPGAGVDLRALEFVVVLAAATYALSSVLGWCQGYLLAGISQRTAYRLRQQVEAKLGRLPLKYFDQNSHGDLLSRVANDVGNLDVAFQEALSQVPTLTFAMLGVLVIMFVISPLLALISLITIPLVLVVASLIAGRSKSRFDAQWEQTGQLTGLVEESFAGHDLVLAFGRQQPMEDEFHHRNQRLARVSFRAQFLSGMILPIVMFVGNINYVAIAVIGGYWVATGAISLGAVQAFVQYSRQLSTPVAQFAGQINSVQSGLASAERVFEFLDAPEEAVITGLAPGAWALPAADGADAAAERPGAARSVRLEHVCFRYAADAPLIEDFTLEAAPGQTVAIVGPTGAGKTTLVNLLVRFYEIDSGRILLDGTDYRDLSRDEVRRCFGMVLQDTWLFGGTIRQNIAYARPTATDEEVEAAARAAHVDDFVATLPDGYATVLDSEASSISAGQKQLLTIARAFLADPGILILDEATSSVDTRTEALIQHAMTRLRGGRTSFVIAHRLSTVRDADTIVVMKGGRVVEQGSHDELLCRRAAYFELYNSQFAGTASS